MPGEKSYVYLDSSKQTNVLNEENARNKNKGFNEIRSCIRKKCELYFTLQNPDLLNYF